MCSERIVKDACHDLAIDSTYNNLLPGGESFG